LINQSHGRARDRASLHASRVCWRRQTVHHWSTRITGRSDGGEAATQFPRCRCLSACRFRRDRLTVRMDRHGVQPSIVQGLIIIQNTQASRRPCLPACRICRIGQGKGQSKARPWRRETMAKSARLVDQASARSHLQTSRRKEQIPLHI
jgi:hypothetical protein